MKSKLNKIVFIGAGNVATAMAKALYAKRNIVQVYSKSMASAKQLGSILKCAFTDDLNKITPDADIYIIAVKDDAIEQVASHLKLKGKMVLHTSGSVDMNVLKGVSSNYGVLYPLQTFSKNSIIKKGISFCVEASQKNVQVELEILVKELKGKSYGIDSKQRAKLHLAAVFVNNFTNHMFIVANDILEENDMPFSLLMPLVTETIDKLNATTPVQAQTGPAIRKDTKTIKKHERMLANKPDYLALYKLLTKSIQQISTHAKEL